MMLSCNRSLELLQSVIAARFQPEKMSALQDRQKADDRGKWREEKEVKKETEALVFAFWHTDVTLV